MSLYPKVKEEFFNQIKSHPILSKDQEVIFEAFWYGEHQHKPFTRKQSKEPYFIHCTQVALSILSEPDVDKDCVIASLLHDSIEDTDTNFEFLEEKFSSKVASMVQALTKLPDSYKKEWGKEKYYKEGFFGKIDEISKTYPFVWKIKLADRSNNLDTYWKFASTEKIAEYVWETHEILKYSKNVNSPLRDKIKSQLANHYS